MVLTALVVHTVTVRGCEKKPADSSRAERLLFMPFVDTASFRLPLSQLQLSAQTNPSYPASAHISTRLCRLSRPLLHNLHDMQPDSSTGGACQVSLAPARSH
jgi:hypothetical protein